MHLSAIKALTRLEIWNYVEIQWFEFHTIVMCKKKVK